MAFSVLIIIIIFFILFLNFFIFNPTQVFACWLPCICPSLFLWRPFPGLPGAPGGEEHGVWEEGNAGGVGCSSGYTTAREQPEWVWETKEPRGERKAVTIPAWGYTIFSSTFSQIVWRYCCSKSRTIHSLVCLCLFPVTQQHSWSPLTFLCLKM